MPFHSRSWKEEGFGSVADNCMEGWFASEDGNQFQRWDKVIRCVGVNDARERLWQLVYGASIEGKGGYPEGEPTTSFVQCLVLARKLRQL